MRVHRCSGVRKSRRHVCNFAEVADCMSSAFRPGNILRFEALVWVMTRPFMIAILVTTESISSRRLVPTPKSQPPLPPPPGEKPAVVGLEHLSSPPPPFHLNVRALSPDPHAGGCSYCCPLRLGRLCLAHSLYKLSFHPLHPL
ncbi:hypothetical protein GW17_00042607 [Ensete ventricosum]|nr:hypothetical protein GW17_00042607 [Ensete ventricosum]